MAPLSRLRLGAACAAGFVAIALTAQLPAHAAPGPGTWTQLTTPGKDTTILTHLGHEGELKLVGRTSSDVSAVNVYCLHGRGGATDATTVATSVPVLGGRFEATVPAPATADHATTCRLRALPTDTNPQDSYLASYAGPLLHLDVWSYYGTPGNEFDFFLQAGRGSGQGQFDSLNSCAVAAMATSLPDLSVPTESRGCLASVGTDSAGTTMNISVDGHPVYASYDQLRYDVPGGKPVRVSVKARSDGMVSWQQTDTLLRCGSDTFPPTSGSCDTARSSGVSIRRTGSYGAADGHQVRLDDAFISTDGKKHQVRVAYQSSYDVPATGRTGLRIPGHGAAFTTPAAGDTVGALPPRAASVLIRSNVLADEGDPEASTWALTWSRAVSRLDFDPDDATIFGTRFGHPLHVPQHGAVHLAFVASVATRTSQAAALAARAERSMMSAPRVVSPAQGEVVQGRLTTVKGLVTSGANGLPTSVSVNGHDAKLEPNPAGTRATYSVTFREPLGKHRLTVVAEDAGGNTRSTSVRVRNH